MLGSLGFAAAAEISDGGLDLAHVVELVLMVAITTNFMQFTWSRCSSRPRGHLGHFSRFASFYAALVATPLLCFPKVEVVVSDLMPAEVPTHSLMGQDWVKQVSAMGGAVSMVAAAIFLSLAPVQDSKLDPLLPTSAPKS